MMRAFKTLHILNKQPGHGRHRLCLSAMAPEDELLLIENAVLAVSQPNTALPSECFVLAADLSARGLAVGDQSLRVISYAEMVDLTASADKIISW